MDTDNFGVFFPRIPVKEYKFLKLTSKNPVIIIQLNETKIITHDDDIMPLFTLDVTVICFVPDLKVTDTFPKLRQFITELRIETQTQSTYLMGHLILKPPRTFPD